MMRTAVALVLFIFAAPSPAQNLALLGGTVIDVADRGRSERDIEDAIVLIEDGVITAVGAASACQVPQGFTRIDVTGKYLVPGLMDGFAVVNNQAYANAFLASGVTSVIAVSGGRRGPLFTEASPGPHLYPLESVGYETKDLPQLLADVDRIADEGHKIALLMYRLTPEKLRRVAQRARERGMGTIGELALCTYREGLLYGVDAFVHTTRYSLALASREMQMGVVNQPFSDSLESPKWRYYKWLSRIEATDEKLTAYARDLAKARVSLMPTASLLYLHHDHTKNPWLEPVAVLLDPKDINKPANRSTGRHDYSPEVEAAYTNLAAATERLDRAYRTAGATYLAGSGTDVWGTMPGISLHTELEALVRHGHTPREALATATSNFAVTFGWREMGEIRAGRRADLVVLDRDPRRDVKNLKSVMKVILRGQILKPKELLQTGREGELLGSRLIPSPASVRVHEITYRSDGFRVKGFLVEPERPGRYPVVIFNRDGYEESGALSEKDACGELARIANWGYVVVAPQYRGVAGGQGRDEVGGADVNDVLNLLPLIDDRESCDSEKIGMIGRGRGGMMTYRALRVTDRIKAAIIEAGHADLIDRSRRTPELKAVFNRLIPGYDKESDATLVPRSVVRWADDLCPQTAILLLQEPTDEEIAALVAIGGHSVLVKRPFRSISLPGLEDRHTPIKSWLDRHLR